jgi:hypothetical protein
MIGDINVLALVRGPERYIFLYDDRMCDEVLRILGRFAANPELSFTWHDAAVLSRRIRIERDDSLRGGRYCWPLPTADSNDSDLS